MIWTFSDTVAVLYQLSYQAIWEMVTQAFLFKPQLVKLGV